MFTDKTTQSVADAVKKIMEADAQKLKESTEKKYEFFGVYDVIGANEKPSSGLLTSSYEKTLQKNQIVMIEEGLVGGQKKIDKNHNNKIDAQDFKILKGQKTVKEEEQFNEVKLADLPVRKIEGKSYGKNYVDPEGADDADDMKSKKKVSKGTYASRATRGFETPAAKAKRDAKIAMRGESFTDLLNSYQENGIKGLFESLERIEESEDNEAQNMYDKAHSEHMKKGNSEKEAHKHATGVMRNKYPNHTASSGEGQVYKTPVKEEILDEEPSNDEFTAELQDAKAKAEGKGKKAEVAKPKVMATSNEEVEQIEERTLTADETDKKEHIVKSMKKGLAGFKERYGKDAKSVMYATATKQAKKD